MDNYTKSNTHCMSEDIRAFAASFALASAKFVPTGKSGNNAHLRYSYANLGDIYKAVKSALREQGIIVVHYTFAIDNTDKEILYTRLIHIATGQYMVDGRYVVSEKPGSQAKGSAETYAKRYALMNLCAIAPEEDDDGQAEEAYINEPCIIAEQVRLLQAEIKPCSNATILHNNILKFNKISKLEELKASSFPSVLNYIKTAKE